MRKAALAALVLALAAAGALLAVRRDAAPRGPRTPFTPLAGEEPEPTGPDVWRLGLGTTRVAVERSTLVETPVGVVELEPGRYEIEGGAGGLRVTVFKGRAVLRDGDRRVEVAEGATGTLVPARAAGSPPEPERPARGDATVRGQVVDGSGNPIEGARVLCDGLVVARTGADGRFSIGLSGWRVHVGVEAAGFAPSDLRRIDPGARTVFEMDFELRHRGGALEVGVRGPDGAPVAGAEVSIGGTWRDLPLRETSREGYPLLAARPRALSTDVSGRAFADGLPPGWNPVRVRARGFALHEGHVRLPPEGTLRHLVELRRGAAVVGSIRDGSGPVEAVRVGLGRGGATAVQTEGDGSFRLADLPSGRMEIVATAADGRQASAWLDLAAGVEARWDGVLGPPLEIAGTVVYADGEPAAGAWVTCEPVFGIGEVEGQLTDDDGAFRFGGVRDALYSVRVAPLAGHAPAEVVRMTPAGSPKAIRIERPGEPGTLVFRVAGAGDLLEFGLHMRVTPAGGMESIDVFSRDASFHESLAAGAYDLEVHVDGKPTLHRRGIEVRAGETVDLGTLRFPEPARIHVTVLDADGTPPEALHVRVESLPQGVFFTVNHVDDGNEAWTEDLAPGRYLVYPGAPGQVVETELAEGETKRIDLRLAPVCDVVLQFLLEDGTAPHEAGYRLADAAGHPVAGGTLTPGEGERRLRLADGMYTLTAADDQGRKATSTLVVAPDTANRPVRITLR